MATVHRITNVSQSASYDFLTGALSILSDTWQMSPPQDGKVVETFSLVAKGATDANIMAAVQTIDELAEAVRLFRDNKKQGNSIWYEYKTTDEASKRALIYSITLMPVSRIFYTPMLGRNAAFYDLAIERDAVWETYAGTTATDTNNPCLGGVMSLAAQAGALPARISSAVITGLADGGTIDRLWLGIRPVNSGLADFNPLWELELGTPGTGFATATDADASPAAGANNSLIGAVGTSSAEAAGITVVQAAPAAVSDDFVGNYLVLLRAKLSAANQVLLQMKCGFSSAATFAPVGEPRPFADTAYRFVEMGEISIPPFSYRNGAQGPDMLKNFEIQIWAERTGAAVNLSLDCLVLVPTDHFVSTAGAAIVAGGARERIYTFEDGEQQAIGLSATDEPNVNLECHPRNWHIPIGGGSLVVAGERTASQVITDKVSIVLNITHRHRTHLE
ncbi:MAG: hypothetical protein EHM70_20745 [Chloroflexota bacterium]|nr:MAG: hypothetical protein EHM70_20745 [Chloroflexota bacterium]